MSIDDNWRSSAPKLYRVQQLRAHNQVQGMAILPGGKYLITSVDSGCRRYAIMVFVLDRPGGEGMPLAKTPTKSKAYNLQAKYMTYNGTQGIMIAYLRRKFKGPDRERGGLVNLLIFFAFLIDNPLLVSIHLTTVPQPISIHLSHFNTNVSPCTYHSRLWNFLATLSAPPGPRCFASMLRSSHLLSVNWLNFALLPPWTA
jgi:hypothetical protein